MLVEWMNASQMVDNSFYEYGFNYFLSWKDILSILYLL